MGKVNIKQKAKIAAAKRRQEENSAPAAAAAGAAATAAPANPFQLQSRPEAPSNVPTVEDFENKSVISFKALHGVAKSKKEKLKLRRKLWHEKIEVCKEKANNKKGKGKDKKSAAGKRKILDGENGFQLLLDSLPSVKDRVNELKASKASINAAAAKAAAEAPEAAGSSSKQP